MKSSLFSVSAACIALLACLSPAAANEIITDVTQPRGQTREIAFDTDEGTWMSVDISPDGSWLVFDMLGHIYRVSAKGGAAVALTQSSGIAMNNHPRISPDGSQIAFISDRAGQENLWVMNADGSNPRIIHRDDEARFAEPAWSPDGTTIYVTKRAKTQVGFYRTEDSIWAFPSAGGPGRVAVQLAAGGEKATSRAGFWSGNYRAQWPSPTRDGKYLYFQSSDFSGGGSRRLVRMNLETGSITAVTLDKNAFQQCCGITAQPSHLLEVAPEISPDGRYMTFARKFPEGKLSWSGQELNGRTALWLRDLETGQERVLMDPISNTLGELHAAWQTKTLPGYAWAPDSRSVVLTQGGKIRRVYLEDGRVETIPFIAKVRRTISEQARGDARIGRTFQAKSLRWPATSHNGKSTIVEAVGQLWIQSPGQSMPRPLTRESSDGFQLTPSWSPDDQWIAFTTWSDDGKGHVWKVRPNGKSLTRLSLKPGRYLNPRWSRDGARLFYSAWPNEVDYEPDDPSRWRLETVGSQGGASRIASDTILPAEFSLVGDDRQFVLKDERLLKLNDPGQAPDVVARIEGYHNSRAAVSPDGRHVAFWHLNDIYLLDIPRSTGGEPITLTPAAGKRLTLEGGYYPSWIDADRLEFTSAARHHVYSVSTGVTTASDVKLEVERDFAKGAVALENVSIIVGDGSTPVQGSVLIADGRIKCVGQCNTSTADRHFQLPGKTVVPGFVDTHAHHLGTEGNDGIIPQRRPDSAAYLAYGVTTVFDPAVSTDLQSFSVGEFAGAGRIIGPITYSTGTALTCGPHSLVRQLDSFEEAQHQVNRLADLGAPSIKDYKQCTRLQRTWLAEAARRRRVSLTSENSDFDYLMGLIMTGHAGWEHPLLVKPTYADVATFLGQAGAHYSTQLSMGSDYPNGSPLEYWLGRTDLWQDRKAMRWHPWQEIAHRRLFLNKPVSDYGFPMQSVTARNIKKAGGYITTGGHGEMKGLDTHFEMWSLASSMAPADVLQAASLGGAHFLGLEKEIGTISAGKLANLVILNSNPLENIRNSADILYVIKEGRFYDGQSLDEIWPRAKPYGSRPWTNPSVERGDVRPDDQFDRETLARERGAR